MKKLFYICLLLMHSLLANAQLKKSDIDRAIPKQNTLKINLLSPFVNAVTLAYERKLNQELSFQTTVSYMNFSGFEYDEKKSTFRSFSICPEIRFVLRSNERDEWFVSAFTRYIYADYEDKPDGQFIYFSGNYLEGKYHSAGLGLTLGKKYTLKNRFTIEIFAGPVYSKILSATSENKIKGTVSSNTHTFYGESLVPRQYVNGYGLRGGLLIGYKF